MMHTTRHENPRIADVAEAGTLGTKTTYTITLTPSPTDCWGKTWGRPAQGLPCERSGQLVPRMVEPSGDEIELCCDPSQLAELLTLIMSWVNAEDANACAREDRRRLRDERRERRTGRLRR